MHDSMFVQILDGPRYTDEAPGRLFGIHRSRPGEPGQTRSRDEIHRKIMLAVELAHLVDPDNVGMPQAPGSPGFAVKPLDVVVSGKLIRKNHLQCNDAIEIPLARLEHDSH